jgi:hypothetical protein
MKIAKVLVNIIGLALVIYVGIFLLWLVFAWGCLNYVGYHGWQDNECGNDVLSQIVRTTHAPIIKLIAPK